MFDALAAQDAELQPWVVFSSDGDGDTTISTWQLRDRDESAVAIFSTSEKANAYAADSKNLPADAAIQNARDGFTIRQLDHVGLIRLFANCHQNQIRFAVLDPTQSEVRRVFSIAEVLKAARETLKQEKGREC